MGGPLVTVAVVVTAAVVIPTTVPAQYPHTNVRNLNFAPPCLCRRCIFSLPRFSPFPSIPLFYYLSLHYICFSLVCFCVPAAAARPGPPPPVGAIASPIVPVPPSTIVPVPSPTVRVPVTVRVAVRVTGRRPEGGHKRERKRGQREWRGEKESGGG